MFVRAHRKCDIYTSLNENTAEKNRILLKCVHFGTFLVGRTRGIHLNFNYQMCVLFDKAN